MVQQVMCSRRPNVYCNEKDINVLCREVGVVKAYSNKIPSTMKGEAFVMYLVHAMLLIFNVKLDGIIITMNMDWWYL